MLANSFYQHQTQSVFNTCQSRNSTSKSSPQLPSIHHLPLPNFSEMTLAPILTKQSASEYRYKCKVCSKSFNRKNSLVRHERIHSGLKPYSCNVCNKQFTRKDILEGHKLSIKCQRRTQYYTETQAFQKSSCQSSSFQSSTPPPVESSRRTSIASLLSSEVDSKFDSIHSLMNSSETRSYYYY
jgi:hypothetical protein